MTPYKHLNKHSDRGRLMKDCDKLFFEILKIERGSKCEVCGRPNPTPAHTLSKGVHPRLRYEKANVHLFCWLPCHYYWHHDREDNRAKKVETYIIKKLGANWHERLKILDKTMPRLTTDYLKLLKLAFTMELERLKKGKL